MMVSEKTIQWLDRLVWLFIYGGLLAVTLGVFVERETHAQWTWLLIGNGTAFALIGFGLIWLRSTMHIRR